MSTCKPRFDVQYMVNGIYMTNKVSMNKEELEEREYKQIIKNLKI